MAEINEPKNTKTELEIEFKNGAAEDRKKRKKVVRVIWNILLTALFLFIVFETVMGILDMQRLNDDKDPLWYIDSSTETADDKTTTTYNLGLYFIDKVEAPGETKIMLKPFFLR